MPGDDGISTCSFLNPHFPPWRGDYSDCVCYTNYPTANNAGLDKFFRHR